RVEARAPRTRGGGRRLMRVKTVTPLSVSYPEPNDNDNIRYLTFCRIESDDGRLGRGDHTLPRLDARGRALIDDMAELVIGRDPMENVDVWRKLKAQTWWHG